MWTCGFFVARVPGATRPEMAGASAFFVVTFALPSYAALWRWAGARRALQVLGALSAFALGIETLAVATGWPYGQFSYGDAIGGKVAGLVPWTVPFAWAPLVLGTYAVLHLARERLQVLEGVLSSTRTQVVVGALALVVADLVLDPGAVRQKFWTYVQPGLYYGVPASNYFGWLLSGLAGHTILLLLLRSCAPSMHSVPVSTLDKREEANLMPSPRVPAQVSLQEVKRGVQGELARVGVDPSPAALPVPPAALATSLTWTLAFWSSVCAWAGLWVPAIIGHASLLALWLLLRPESGLVEAG